MWSFLVHQTDVDSGDNFQTGAVWKTGDESEVTPPRAVSQSLFSELTSGQPEAVSGRPSARKFCFGFWLTADGLD